MRWTLNSATFVKIEMSGKQNKSRVRGKVLFECVDSGMVTMSCANEFDKIDGRGGT